MIQVLLCLCFKSELITEMENIEDTKGKVFRPKDSNKPYYRLPRYFLGKNYQYKTVKADRADREYHVLGWWRKGFWRNQPYGSKTNPSYRPTWIEPTWCQPS